MPAPRIRAGNVGVLTISKYGAVSADGSIPTGSAFEPDETLRGNWENSNSIRQYRLPGRRNGATLCEPLLSFLAPENRYPPLDLSPQRQRQKMLETLVSMLLELAEHQPVLFILEDLHWTDPTTLEFLASADRPHPDGCALIYCSPAAPRFSRPGAIVHYLP